jgi:hypothetical protein
MMETIQPPTDNLYKFIAIGGLAFALVAFIFLFREQARIREQLIQAEVELRVGGYVEGSGEPADQELRRAYFRRDAAMEESSGLLKLASGMAAKVVGWSLGFSAVGFGLWWWRVQRLDDAILIDTAAKLKQEARTAAHANAGQ